MESIKSAINELVQRIEDGSIKTRPDDPSCPLGICDGKGLLFIEDAGRDHEWEGYDPRVRECACVEYSAKLARLETLGISWKAKQALSEPELFNPAHQMATISNECFLAFRANRDPNKRIFLFRGPTGTGKTTCAWRTIGAMSRERGPGRDYTRIAYWRSLQDLWNLYRFQRRDEWPATERRLKGCSICFIDECDIGTHIDAAARESVQELFRYILELMDDSGFYLFLCSNLNTAEFSGLLEERVLRRIHEGLVLGKGSEFYASVIPIMRGAG